MDLVSTTESPALSEDERQLIDLFRRCSDRRKFVVIRFTGKLSALEWPIAITRQVVDSNVVPFKRRKTD
jgi:hypothetical protein